MPIDKRVTLQVENEQVFWSTDRFERPGEDTLENFLNKAQDAAILFPLVMHRISDFRQARRIAEVGGGQGWASCLVKRLVPEAHVVLTDAVHEAVQSKSIWERAFNCTLDGAYAAPAQSLPFGDGELDLIFCFAAAHHFIDYRTALQEAKRVLAPRGKCLWLYEPTATSWLKPAAERRVNRKRPDVPEHVIVAREIVNIARSEGLTCEVEYCTSIAHRGRGAMVYYAALSISTMLQRLLPCTAHFTFGHSADRLR